MLPFSESPAYRNALPALVLATALASSGCTATPLDATLLEDDGQPVVPQDPECPLSVPEATEVYLMSESRRACLTAGTVTSIEGATPGVTGYTVELRTCEQSADQRWELIPGTFSQWEIRNLALDLNLDLEGNHFFDGTEALLYTPHGGINQVFGLEPMENQDFRIKAQNTDNSCLQAMGSDNENAVELHGCTISTSLAQLWWFSPVDCGGS